MFSNQRRGNAGLGSILAVALVLAGFVASAGLMVKVYQDGGNRPAGCEVVCRQVGGAVVKG